MKPVTIPYMELLKIGNDFCEQSGIRNYCSTICKGRCCDGNYTKTVCHSQASCHEKLPCVIFTCRDIWEPFKKNPLLMAVKTKLGILRWQVEEAVRHELKERKNRTYRSDPGNAFFSTYSLKSVEHLQIPITHALRDCFVKKDGKEFVGTKYVPSGLTIEDIYIFIPSMASLLKGGLEAVR